MNIGQGGGADWIETATGPHPVVGRITASVTIAANETAFGYATDALQVIRGGRVDGGIANGCAFSISGPAKIEGVSPFFVVTHAGWRGLNVYGVQVEPIGRLAYINNCTDTLLIPPPRQGDPCISSLHFPPATSQDFHVHPSVRVGMVISGRGVADVKNHGHEISAGVPFIIEPFELHRFRTNAETMVVIAFHPDSDWGPTDSAHPMLNRTYQTAPSAPATAASAI